MDNLRKAIEILFFKQNPEALLNRNSVWNDLVHSVNKEQFKQTFLSERGPYSGNQANQLYDLLSKNWMVNNNKTSIFNVLYKFGEKVLRIQNGNPVCQYVHYLRWHELSSCIGEDILTCSFLAGEELNSNDIRKSFGWNLVLESDNCQLDSLFQRKLTELHCHLNGSSLNFDANWLAIMNEPKYQMRKWYGADDGVFLYENAILAAYIRMYLYLSVNSVSSGNHYIGIFEKIWCAKDRLSLLDFYLADLQTEISVQSSLRGHQFGNCFIDYAIPVLLSKADEEESVTKFIVGERKLMYQCFRKIYMGDTHVAGLPIMFYYYLVVKNKVKSILIQHNGIKGFENFKQFDVEKERFVKNAKNRAYQKMIPQAAIQSFQKNPHIKYFEFRVAPKDTASANRNKLNKLEKWFISGKQHCVLHFIKQADQEHCFEHDFQNAWKCRNSDGRKCYSRMASAIEILVRRNEKRIVGIDAANSEFGCRPEVFGEVYRRLQHIQRDTSMDFLINNNCKDLGFTFHVGEDYYDVVDGLRAIEEAILFLNLTDGCRLGHAVALGIDTYKYYAERKRTIIIPKQDLLDNCVWLLSKMDEYSINGVSGVRSSLLNAYQQFMYQIYPDFCDYDYRLYYQSWLLRGDNPYLYQTKKDIIDSIDKPYALNNFDSRIKLARQNERARNLYCAYHFSPKSKDVGHQPEEIHLPQPIMNVIDTIQKKMRYDVAKRKIAIEVNPTSNLRICNIDTYDTHPITKFRNYGLKVFGENNDCPQISVSINTDDQGIFATSIEKEYTLLSLAMEKMKNDRGEAIYQSNNILDWLEDIRKQGFVQRFALE